MAWETSDRAARLPADWSKRRAATRRRAGGRCEGLGADGWHVDSCPGIGSECDHHEAGDDHSLSNLRWLSTPCHTHKTTVLDRQAWKRAPEPHPGLRG